MDAHGERGDEPVLDAAQLDALWQFARNLPGAYAELITEHLGFVDSSLQRLRVALRDDDRDAIRRQAHSLRGSAAQFGSPLVARAAGALEDAMLAGHTSVAAALADAVERAVARARGALERECLRTT